MFNKLKIKNSINRVIEDKYYAQVALEMSEGDINIGTWTRAKANAEGDERKTEALYIKYRVQSLHDEIHAINTLHKEADKIRQSPAVKKQIPEKKEINTASQIKKDTNFTSKDLCSARSAIMQGDIDYIKINSGTFPDEATNQLIEYSDLCGEEKIFTYLTDLSNLTEN